MFTEMILHNYARNKTSCNYFAELTWLCISMFLNNIPHFLHCSSYCNSISSHLWLDVWIMFISNHLYTCYFGAKIKFASNGYYFAIYKYYYYKYRFIGLILSYCCVLWHNRFTQIWCSNTHMWCRRFLKWPGVYTMLDSWTSPDIYVLR